MTQTLVDTNVLLDLLVPASAWYGWSGRQVAMLANDGGVALNQVIYAELAAGFLTPAALEELFPPSAFVRLELPWEAAAMAGQAYRLYRSRGGSRERVLPDFLIGAHASVAGLRLLTRDASRYRGYFPGLALIAP